MRGQLVFDFRGPRPGMFWDGDEYRVATLRMGQTGLGDPGCPVEAGFLGALVDLECRHGLMPGDRTCCP